LIANQLHSTSLAESDRKRRKASNNSGDPVKFPSKLLAVSVNQYSSDTGTSALIAQADGSVSNINTSTGEISRVGRNAQAPITCVASYSGRVSLDNHAVTRSVFAGGWDKHITHFVFGQGDYGPGAPVAQTSFKAHADFVKCLLIAQTPDKQMVLLSGGADGDINIWTFEGRRLVCLRPQSRGIECIALDPFSSPETPRIFFSTSQREIYHFVLPASAAISKDIKISEPIIQHETSVYKLEFDNDGDLWTASADKTAKRLLRENNFTADTTLAHPDFVRDIVIYGLSGLAITACRDEEIRLWNTASSQLMHVFSGHFEEITALALTGTTLLSVSIDATLRKWSIAPSDLQKATDEAKNPALVEKEPEPKSGFGDLTEEEEAQLRALMEDEESEALDKMARDEQ